MVVVVVEEIHLPQEEEEKKIQDWKKAEYRHSVSPVLSALEMERERLAVPASS